MRLEDQRIVTSRAIDPARNDGLTGLPDRGAFAELLDRTLPGTARAAVLLVDLDEFERVNLSMGHEVGDELLVAVAARLSGCLRPADTIARVGDDEFAILIADITRAGEASELAAELLANLRAPFAIAGRRLVIGGSIGIAIAGPGDSTAVRRAAAALREAKRNGRGSYQVFDRRLREAAREQLAVETELQRALEGGELFLEYQPLVQLAGGRLVGVEALVRWMHPERGRISPDRFIPVAEETGLIVPLGGWVLREACGQAASWHRVHDELFVSVNVSGAQLEQPNVVDEILAAVRDEGVRPHRVVLEITETVLLHDMRRTAEKLAALEAAGIRLAVDDFGTGYSSLQYLSGFPIDILKVAKPVVDGLRRAGKGAALARAIVGLGQSFGVTVVGEGIESVQQRDELIELGCDLGQGFLFGRPTDVAGIEALLANPTPVLAQDTPVG